MHQAKTRGAHLLHTSEASLSGYAGVDFATFDDFDWDLLRHETTALCRLARELELWLVLGSAHYLDAKTKPTNCLYLINPSGRWWIGMTNPCAPLATNNTTLPEIVW